MDTKQRLCWRSAPVPHRAPQPECHPECLAASGGAQQAPHVPPLRLLSLPCPCGGSFVLGQPCCCSSNPFLHTMMITPSLGACCAVQHERLRHFKGCGGVNKMTRKHERHGTKWCFHESSESLPRSKLGHGHHQKELREDRVPPSSSSCPPSKEKKR